MSIDFTLKKYEELCQKIKLLSCSIMTVKEFMENGQPNNFTIVIRHDVDRFMLNALHMAELEKQYGIHSSYYVRVIPKLFIPHNLQYIYNLNHEVGYHYEVLSKTKGNITSAIELFVKELNNLRLHVPVFTVSMHGSPLTPWNNLIIWNYNDCRNFELLGDVSLDINYKNIYYITDTGRSWNSNVYNIRDYVYSKPIPRSIHTTDELIHFLNSGLSSPVFLNIHPNRWSKGYTDYLISIIIDYLSNWVKYYLQIIYSRKNRRNNYSCPIIKASNQKD